MLLHALTTSSHINSLLSSSHTFPHYSTANEDDFRNCTASDRSNNRFHSGRPRICVQICQHCSPKRESFYPILSQAKQTRLQVVHMYTRSHATLELLNILPLTLIAYSRLLSLRRESKEHDFVNWAQAKPNACSHPPPDKAVSCKLRPSNFPSTCNSPDNTKNMGVYFLFCFNFQFTQLS